MKIWCDACNQTEATVFCSADEAALCQDCDVRVHQANELASKHHRLSLLQPTSSLNLPLCDICQEGKALLFCQQDRAVICRDCDVSIHTANELTRKHNRFLLTGAKLSLLSSMTTTTTTTTTKNMTKSDSARVELDPLPDSWAQPKDSTIITHDVNNQSSGISEYYSMEMFPEWQVEGLLDTSLDPNSFDDELLFLNDGFMVPQASTLLQPSLFNPGIFGVNEIEGTKGGGGVSNRVSRKMMDDGFTVPQISPQSIVSKRSRPIW